MTSLQFGFVASLSGFHVNCSIYSPRERAVIKSISILLKDGLTGSDWLSPGIEPLTDTAVQVFVRRHQIAVYTMSRFTPCLHSSSSTGPVAWFLTLTGTPYTHTHTHTNRERQLDMRLPVFVNFSSAFFVRREREE